MKLNISFYLKIGLFYTILLNINCATYHKISQSTVSSDEYVPVKSVISDNYQFIQQFINSLFNKINKFFGKYYFEGFKTKNNISETYILFILFLRFF